VYNCVFCSDQNSKHWIRIRRFRDCVLIIYVVFMWWLTLPKQSTWLNYFSSVCERRRELLNLLISVLVLPKLIQVKLLFCMAMCAECPDCVCSVQGSAVTAVMKQRRWMSCSRGFLSKVVTSTRQPSLSCGETHILLSPVQNPVRNKTLLGSALTSKLTNYPFSVT
jgi:hypothetical protein